MCQITSSVAFCTRKIENTKKDELYDIIEQMSIKTRDYAFLSDVIEGLDNKQLAAKYKKSASRICQWKRRVFEKLHRFIVATS